MISKPSGNVIYAIGGGRVQYKQIHTNILLAQDFDRDGAILKSLVHKNHIIYHFHLVFNRFWKYPHHTRFILHRLIVAHKVFSVILKYFYDTNSL